MKQKIGAVAVLVTIAIAFWLWRSQRTHSTQAPVATGSNAMAVTGSGSSASLNDRARRIDPTKQARGSIAGTVKDAAGAGVPKAAVCADYWSDDLSTQQTRDPICLTADEHGAYMFKDLLAAEYSIDAVADGFEAATYRPHPEDPLLRSDTSFPLAAGENRTGIDLVLRKGGVELTGTVSDINGGPIANARVRAQNWDSEAAGAPITTSDAQGHYKLWTRKGAISVTATADGYADGDEGGYAPGTVDIKLTPESAIAGVVKDESGAVVAGASVTISGAAFFSRSSSDISDEQGRFRITRLKPGRFKPEATAASGYGMARDSVLLGLGQVVEGVEVVIHSASYVEGTVLIPGGNGKQPCVHASVELEDNAAGKNEWGNGDVHGVVRMRGVRPGHYKVTVQCRGYQKLEVKEPLDIVQGKDRTGLQWTVTDGASLVGTITQKGGAPVVGARVLLQSKKPSGSMFEGNTNTRTDEFGHYQLRGVTPGAYSMRVASTTAPSPKIPFDVELTLGTVVTKDVVLDLGGTLRATVVDNDGQPVKGVDVQTRAMESVSGMMFFFGGGGAPTGADGVVTKEGLAAGTYRVTAQRSWSNRMRKPGSTDDDVQGEKVVVKAGETSTVRLVVESQRGVITGNVVDSGGDPIVDAYIVAARESDAAGASATGAMRDAQWSWDEAVLTDAQGKFAVKELGSGKYTVRAYRKGGGEAYAEHVAVGATVTLTVKKTGLIEGSVVGKAGPPAEFTVEIADRTTHFSREESFYATNGTFAMRDLPAGNFEVTVTAGSATATEKVSLQDGETKSGIVLKLGETVTVTGIIVDEKTKAPVVGLRMMVSPVNGGNNMAWGDTSENRVTDAKGRFTVDNVAVGAVVVWGFSMAPDFGWHGLETRADIPVTAQGTVDLGTYGSMAKRIKPPAVAGDNGLSFQQDEDWRDVTPLKVARVDPAGPAAKLDIKAGDIIVAADGIDVSGNRRYLFDGIMEAAPGTKIELSLARGTKVTVTLAGPK